MQAVIDIGSNSILLLIASRDADGTLCIQEDLSEVARLSEGVSERGTLSDEAIARALAVLEAYKVKCDALGLSIRAVATEGVRMASDRERFLGPAGELLGSLVEAISGEEEARLSYLSVAQEAPQDTPLRVIDIGGASTELVHGRGLAIDGAQSHRIGSVRLSEAFIPDREAVVSRAQISAIEAQVDRALAQQPLAPQPQLHGLAGTVTSCAALLLELEQYDRERVDHSRFGVQQVVELRNHLAAMTNRQRVENTLLPAKRADVIVAGLTVLVQAMRHCGARELVVRDRGLRYALIERQGDGSS